MNAIETAEQFLSNASLQVPEWAPPPLRATINDFNTSLGEAADLYRHADEWRRRQGNPDEPVSQLAKAESMVSAYLAKARTTAARAASRMTEVTQAAEGPTATESKRCLAEVQRVAAEVTAELAKLGFAAGLREGLAEQHCALVHEARARLLMVDAWFSELLAKRSRARKFLAAMGNPPPKPATKPSVPQANRKPMTRLGMLSARDAEQLEAMVAEA